MGRTVYYTASTLDGFLADEHDSLSWLLRQDVDPAGPFGYDGFIAGVGAMVMGATTYRWLLDHLDPADGWPYEQPCWVMTRRTFPAPSGDVRFAAGPVVDLLPALRAAAGERDLWVVGGGDLAGQFADVGALDEIEVSFAPVTLGAGRPLLPRPLDLELLDVARNRSLVCARYRVAGPLAASVP
ncbi:dihydrofolate reductase family protein [Nocardioides sp. TRM66260-LWL]|uniref:dihydrofolate reductase family protein n=1 Tax=Nocardioides sp. TRM66260-LWL TaxID=2874478 RepID=UPI001CC43D18|nr:dihydrofolate reductase family protein [Nocardioides sp. TRM66260-LWL]MBZ5734626.1 dihydrofolate reductase family protein [Nocardioides sp. TRM66260-LWL]